MEWPCNSAVSFSPVEDMEIWNASSNGFSFVISYESSAGPGFQLPKSIWTRRRISCFPPPDSPNFQSSITNSPTQRKVVFCHGAGQSEYPHDPQRDYSGIRPSDG